MEQLDQQCINQLPVHDSDFLKLSLVQRDTGEIDILLHITFYEGEYDDLPQYKEIIGDDGRVCFLLEDCTYISLISHCGIIQRDSVDYINICEIAKGKVLRKQVEMFTNSGMKLTCESDRISLVKP